MYFSQMLDCFFVFLTLSRSLPTTLCDCSFNLSSLFFSSCFMDLLAQFFIRVFFYLDFYVKFSEIPGNNSYLGINWAVTHTAPNISLSNFLFCPKNLENTLEDLWDLRFPRQHLQEPQFFLENWLSWFCRLFYPRNDLKWLSTTSFTLN